MRRLVSQFVRWSPVVLVAVTVSGVSRASRLFHPTVQERCLLCSEGGFRDKWKERD